jgi:hypothetical protein
LDKLQSAKNLRDRAGHYLRLARSISADEDVARFEALAAEADQAAALMEDEEDSLPAAQRLK